jgi:inosose dehydratase
MLSEMALAGYAGTELGSFYPTDAGELRHALDLHGLAASGAWVSTYFASDGGAYERTLDDFRSQLPFFAAVGLRDVYVAEVTGAVHQQPVPALANRPVFDGGQWSADRVGPAAACRADAVVRARGGRPRPRGRLLDPGRRHHR